jgi:peptidoglycan/xylan/chitin deacetylase (PgdA/CDA1 family)
MTGVIALGYHGVSERWPSPLAVKPDDLRRQVEHLLGRGLRPATVAQAASAPANSPRLVVTFDDALASVYDHAFPILRDLGVVATVYVPTVAILSGTPMGWPEVSEHLDGEHAAELNGMTPDQLREVADAGWEIGSHTRTHPWLPQLDASALRDELIRSRAELRRALGVACLSLAYPFGAVDDRVVAAARAAGYETAVTLPRRVEPWPGPGHDQLRLARIGVYRDDDMRRFRLKVAGPVRALRASALWEALGPRRAAR